MHPEECPKCGVSLKGDPIPEDVKKYYHGDYFYRVKGIEFRGVYDGVAAWECPDCLHVWSRFEESK